MRKRERKEGFLKNKRAQVSVFIVIGLVIIAAAIIAFVVVPKTSGPTSQSIAENPSQYMSRCMQADITTTVNKLGIQGGEMNPTHYIAYKNSNVKYLCYTSDYAKLCVVQEPMLITSFANQLKDNLKAKSDKCFEDLKNNLAAGGYAVDLRVKDSNMEITSKKINLKFNIDMTINKDQPQKFETIDISVNNNIYELLAIANSIVEFETSLGDSETTTYMDYYHDVKVEKMLNSDGTTIYTLTNRNSGEMFQFASRSLAMPPGYGL